MTDRIATIGVVGAGTMGAGIAQVAAQAGYDVMLVDMAEPMLDRGLAAITANLDRQVAKGRLDDHRRDIILARIEGAVRIDLLATCDLVIEAVTESLETKSHVFRQVAGAVAPG
ncbi:MAG TPA: 3-hydroxyacyl-CoA dehydrogenase NAD-binding domain-containing protein, partial [Thermomicrobiales bacterium]|nr:3-hydroxyacyl-CoA dehydrogenase NAD-binding domain-containing protein [Thermomicrobiales bacterium]